MSVEELLKWADEVLSPRAKLAYEGNGELSAGEHCRFCIIKATCRKRAAYSLELAKYDSVSYLRGNSSHSPAD